MDREYINYKVQICKEDLIEILEDHYDPEEVADWTEDKLKREGRDFLEATICDYVSDCYVFIGEDDDGY